MKVELSPFQEIYNKVSLTLDKYETDLKPICESIKKRILEIISNGENYNLDSEVERVDGQNISSIIKGIIYAVFPEDYTEAATRAYDFEGVIRLFFIDEISEGDKSPILKRFRHIQRLPFTLLKSRFKTELDHLLTLWVSIIEHCETDPTDSIRSTSLPSRLSVLESNVTKGISCKEWFKVAS